MDQPSSHAEAQVARIVNAIEASASPVTVSQMIAADFPAQVPSDAIGALRSAVGSAMDRVGFGSLDWDGFYSILNALDDFTVRKLEALGEDTAKIQEMRAAYAIERILFSSRRQQDDGSTEYDRTDIARCVQLAEAKGLLGDLGARGEELRQLGNVARLTSPRIPSKTERASPGPGFLARLRKALRGLGWPTNSV